MLGLVLEFFSKMTAWCKHTHSAIYDVMKSYLTSVWDKKTRNGYLTWETRSHVIKKKLLNESWKMLLSEPLASLIAFFRTSLIKF